MDCAAQWVNNVSVITANAQLASCSIRSHPYDVDVNSRALVSPRHPLSSQNSTRGLTPEGSESPEPFDSYSGPSDEHEASLETGPEELDDPWPYTFRVGDSVWIRTEGGKWYPGKVSSNNIKRGQTRQKEGLFYPVIFRIGSRMRKHFAPLNGEIKPDTLQTRTLLRRAGWL